MNEVIRFNLLVREEVGARMQTYISFIPFYYIITEKSLSLLTTVHTFLKKTFSKCSVLYIDPPYSQGCSKMPSLISKSKSNSKQKFHFHYLDTAISSSSPDPFSTYIIVCVCACEHTSQMQTFSISSSSLPILVINLFS